MIGVEMDLMLARVFPSAALASSLAETMIFSSGEAMFELAYIAVQLVLYGAAVGLLWLVLPGWAFGLACALVLLPFALLIAEALGVRWARPLSNWLMTGRR